MIETTNHAAALETPATEPLGASPRNRWISAAEFLMGAGIVIGHNVYHKIPNEVPILFVLCLVSMRVRNGSWLAMGLRLPKSWKKTVLLGLAAAAVRILLGQLVIDPLTAHVWPPAAGPKGMNTIAGHPLVALEWLTLVWTFAALGEEIGYRGYLLNRAADVGGRWKAADWLAVLASAALFGLGHYYKGWAGVIDSGMAGLVLGAAYLGSKRNLWVCVLAHGFIDTFAVLALYFGLAS